MDRMIDFIDSITVAINVFVAVYFSLLAVLATVEIRNRHKSRRSEELKGGSDD